MNCKTEFIDISSKYLPDVKLLGRKNSATLGFMPNGGFDDYAKRKNIIVATENEILVGYLMFRTGQKNTRITIVHLCVNDNYRGKGVSLQLLDELKNKYNNNFCGIYLNCREDFKYAANLWGKYGFTQQNKIRSRSTDEHYLITWFYDLNMPDIFKSLPYDSSKVCALLDTNIIVKLRDADNNGSISATEDPRCLLADWLATETKFYYAPEIYNEIDRDADRHRTDYTRRFLNAFSEAYFDKKDEECIANELKNIIKSDTENDISDRKQVATCIAAQIRYFITYDAGILNKREEIEDKYDIQLYNPQEFITQIDKLIHTEDYVPVQLKGVNFHTMSKVNPLEISLCIDKFLNKKFSEEKKIFSEIVYNVINSKKNNVYVIKQKDKIIAFYGIIYDKNICYIKFLRIDKNSIKYSLFTQIISDTIKNCLKDNVYKIDFCEKYIDTDSKSMLLKQGFTESEDGAFIKHIVDKIIYSNELQDILGYMQINMGECQNNDVHIQTEQLFFPLKIRDLGIPVYIIPIKVYWAGQLFDYMTSAGELFGAEPDKLWNFENVYYRHTKPIREKCPARILWYVSGDKDYSRSKAIVASSLLTDVKTDKPKNIFREYKHYGIYQWNDIYELCGGNVENEIRALKFCCTEVFSEIIPYDKIQEILIKHGQRRNTFASPVEVSEDIYFDIYQLGKCGKRK